MSEASNDTLYNLMVRSIGYAVIIHAKCGSIIGGVVREVDTNRNLLLEPGLLYGTDPDNQMLRDLVPSTGVNGDDISSFSPGPYIGFPDFSTEEEPLRIDRGTRNQKKKKCNKKRA